MVSCFESPVTSFTLEFVQPLNTCCKIRPGTLRIETGFHAEKVFTLTDDTIDIYVIYTDGRNV